MKILVVTPWPDSPETIAGTIIKEAKRGHEIHVLCLSKGGGHRTDISFEKEEKTRMKEQRLAASIEGVKKVHFLNMKNLGIFDTLENRRAVMRVIKRIQPKMVIMPWFKDTHPDIVATGNIVLAACFMAAAIPEPTAEGGESKHSVETVYMFESVGSLDFEPDVYIDISDVAELKKEAISKHQDTAKLFKSGDINDVVNAFLAGDVTRAIKCGGNVKYAEAFKRWTYPHGARLALDHLPES